ncbi:MAG: Ig domain-containing protein [Eubacteriales bacterium]
MNKRITSLMLCFVMVLSMLVTAVPVMATGSVDLKVTADKTEASPGDTITFTITLGPVSDMGTMQMDLVIPEGMTYVANSGKLADGLKETLGFDTADWTEVTKRINGVASAADYSSDKNTVLATFQCTVNDGASGTLEVGLDNLEFYSCQTWDDHTEDYLVVKASVNITAAPKPATAVSLNKSTLELTVGESETLVATVAPADTTDTVTWDTGRSDIATVDSTGKVTAVAPGTAVIAARAGEKSAFCTVTVVAAPCTHTNKTNVGEKPSTCKEQGWEAYSKCNDCGQLFDKDGNQISAIPYLSLAAHKYTANEKKPEALKTAGTCKDKAIYLRSCEVCGKVAPSEAWGSFFGDLDPNNHAGGTTTVNAREPDHKNQVAGYTGDTKCLGCNEIIATGTSIPAGAHTPSSTWSSDGDYHWKTCSVAGCGVIIDGSKAAHTSTGANVATCQHKAVCDVCGVEYGEFAGHNPASGWTNDASGHWHPCQTAGCTEKCDFVTHTPDHEGHATEEYAIKCTECDYVIEAQLDHTHSLTKVEAKPATCTENGNIEYYKCSGCGKLFADATGNVEITADKTVDKATGHQYEWVIDKEATATEKGSKHEECAVCHNQKAAVEIPATGTPIDPPQTGDNSMMGLWIALLFVSGIGVVGTMIYGRKKKYFAK